MQIASFNRPKYMNFNFPSSSLISPIYGNTIEFTMINLHINSNPVLGYVFKSNIKIVMTQINIHQMFQCLILTKEITGTHCVEGIDIHSNSGPHLPAFELNTEGYSVSVRIQHEWGKHRPE